MINEISIKVISMDYHRNGISGAPFYAILFTSNDTQNDMLGIVFEEKYHVAVLDTIKISSGDIKFGSNSWRGDRFEPALRAAIKKEDKEFSI
jgi:hypothetical protein